MPVGPLPSMAGGMGENVGARSSGHPCHRNPLFLASQTRCDAVTKDELFFPLLELFDHAHAATPTFSPSCSSRNKRRFKMAAEKAPLPFGYTFMAGKLSSRWSRACSKTTQNTNHAVPTI